MKFSELGLKADIVESIGFEQPTHIQEQSIPLILQGKDVIGQSATGSGKTLAFSAGIIQNLTSGTEAVVLVPTRELCLQVAKEFQKFSKHIKANVVTVYGGVGIEPQIKAAKKANIIVATPGRFLDLLNRKAINTKEVKTFVLDEADIMVDMGFIDDVRKIERSLPKNRQTLLFSATLDGMVNKISKTIMRDPITIRVKSHVDHSKLYQAYINVPMRKKFSLLVELIRQDEPYLAIVFCNTRRTTDLVEENLKAQDIKAKAIHGGLTQSKRTKIIDDCRNNKLHILVCTDVAARGLHIDDISHVYNYDVPNDARQYMHRVGRTARAGKEGVALTILAEPDYDNFSKVLRLLPEKIPREELPEMEDIPFKVPKREPRRGGNRGGPRRGGPRSGNKPQGNRRPKGRRPKKQ